MKRKVILLVLVIVLLISQGLYVYAQEVKVMCLSTGDSYLKFGQEYKIAYVIGTMDTILTMLQTFAPDRYEKYRVEIEGMTANQVIKILDKYLEKNPEMLHYCAPACLLYALDGIIYE
ncbi:MAG: hypothetical protein JW870_14835 [Candidatus Delongbacteria bacterium]|nr:hypothetical protein [Candidatus Delongbacteria bacterium]